MTDNTSPSSERQDCSDTEKDSDGESETAVSANEIAVSMYAEEIFFESQQATVSVESLGAIVSVGVHAGESVHETKVQMAMTPPEVEQLITELEAATESARDFS